ncbi:MAG TPA: hypothetical protein VFV34_24625 [Blastocatellia bacterium]|nr:hypothetical protein [Blastocatellia bacterium]
MSIKSGARVQVKSLVRINRPPISYTNFLRKIRAPDSARRTPLRRAGRTPLRRTWRARSLVRKILMQISLQMDPPEHPFKLAADNQVG